MNNAEFLRKQLIVLAACVPTLYALIFFPFALLIGISLLLKPLYAIAVILIAGLYALLGVVAWRRRHFIWTTIFVLLSSAPLVGQFVVMPELQKRNFRKYRQIPDDAKIMYYRESGLRDVTRFCLIEHPPGKSWQWTPSYRPFLPGALDIMKKVQRDLGIPEYKMPDPNKRSVTYSGGENESAPGDWMFLDVMDFETRHEWIFEYGY